MPIEGVVYDYREADHEDRRRAIVTAFNGDLGDFVARQVKIALIKEEATLGGHYHEYDELYYLLEGKGSFTLKEIATGLIEKYEMAKGNRLYIPRRVAHKAVLKPGSILIGCTGQPYASAIQNDYGFEF
ncbi:hypothetical protein JXB28_05000 [Candidatus Woesearchaeota archaeon]|nr:hypothetical protein [Candidatus Woesearchaeota archaeon]